MVKRARPAHIAADSLILFLVSHRQFTCGEQVVPSRLRDAIRDTTLWSEGQRSRSAAFKAQTQSHSRSTYGHTYGHMVISFVEILNVMHQDHLQLKV